MHKHHGSRRGIEAGSGGHYAVALQQEDGELHVFGLAQRSRRIERHRAASEKSGFYTKRLTPTKRSRSQAR